MNALAVALVSALTAALARDTPEDPPPVAAPIEASASVRPAARGLLERRARELEAELGVPVSVEAQGVDAPLTSLRIGRPGAPEIAVVDAELIAPVGPEGGGARVERAVALARALRPRMSAEGGAPADYAAVIALGPAERDEAPLAVARDLNFPTRWLEARAVHGGRAGLFPGERIEVARVVDWLLVPSRSACIGVVELGGTAVLDDDGRWPAGSLGAFVAEGMSRGFRAVGHDESAVSAMVDLRRAAPEVLLQEVSRRRLGSDTWVVELRISWRRGVETGDPARRVHLAATARGVAAPAWIAVASRVPGARAYTVLPAPGGGGARRAMELPCGGATALRLVVHGAGEAPEVAVRLTSPGVVAAPLAVSLAPPGGALAKDAGR